MPWWDTPGLSSHEGKAAANLCLPQAKQLLKFRGRLEPAIFKTNPRPNRKFLMVRPLRASTSAVGRLHPATHATPHASGHLHRRAESSRGLRARGRGSRATIHLRLGTRCAVSITRVGTIAVPSSPRHLASQTVRSFIPISLRIENDSRRILHPKPVWRSGNHRMGGCAGRRRPRHKGLASILGS